MPELGYYLIVTDTEETEKNYFEGLRDNIPVEMKDRLGIKVEKAKNGRVGGASCGTYRCRIAVPYSMDCF